MNAESIQDSLGRFIFPRDQVGKKVWRLSHFPNGIPRDNEDPRKKSLPHTWKRFKIEQVAGLLPNKEEVKKIELRVVSGECSDADTIELALERGMTVLMICGNMMANREVRDKYLEMLSRYGDRFRIYKLDKRPDQHGLLLKLPNTRHLLLEDPHEHNEWYKTALIVEDSTESFSNEYFDNQFQYWISKLKPLDGRSLREIKLYDGPDDAGCTGNTITSASALS